MSFTRDDVQALARLARLRLSAEEEDLFARQLTEIVDYARQVAAVDTSGLSESAPGPGTPLREDEAKPSLDAAAPLDAAPAADARTRLIKVPRVIG